MLVLIAAHALGSLVGFKSTLDGRNMCIVANMMSILHSENLLFNCSPHRRAQWSRIRCRQCSLCTLKSKIRPAFPGSPACLHCLPIKYMIRVRPADTGEAAQPEPE